MSADKILCKKKKSLLPSDYLPLLANIKERVVSAHISAARAVNRELILLYWDIGQVIVDKQRAAKWGDSVVEQLAADLRAAFPDMRGFSTANVWRMRQLYETHSHSDFLAQLARALKSKHKTGTLLRLLEPVVPADEQCWTSQILAQGAREICSWVPWGHHILLLGKGVPASARLYYLQAAFLFGWTRRVLLNQIKAKAYEHAITEKKAQNFPLALPEQLADQACEMMKSRYTLEFLGVNRAVKERELEDRLITNLQSFLLELGYGFCFVGRQYRLSLGSKEYFVDLLFYHRFLKALIAFDLKIGAFEPEHAGKMDFYLNLLNDKERAPEDAPSIGIILCAEKDDVEVEFSLRTKSNPIGVAEYQLRAQLPRELKGQLPTARQLGDAVRKSLSQTS